MLPWFDTSGELFYESITIRRDDGIVDKRQCFRIIRSWYTKQIGVTVCKQTLNRLWKHRVVGEVPSEERMNQMFQEFVNRVADEEQD